MAPKSAITHLKTKKELIEYMIDTHHEEPDPSWTSVEIRSRLRELEIQELGETNTILKNMSKDRKSVLVTKAGSLGIHVPEHATRGWLMRAIRDEVWLNDKAKPTDSMRFGKHAHRTYAEVLNGEPSYCKWVHETCTQVTEQDEKPGRQLVRFHTWLMAQKEDAAKKEKPTSSRSTSPPAESLSVKKENRRSASPPKRRVHDDDELIDDRDLKEKMKEEEKLRDKYVVGAMASVLERLDLMNARLMAMEAKGSSSTSSFSVVEMPVEPTAKGKQ